MRADVIILIRTRDLPVFLGELQASGRDKPGETDSEITDRPGVTALSWGYTRWLDAEDYHFLDIPFCGSHSDGEDCGSCEFACDGLETADHYTWNDEFAVTLPADHDPDLPVPPPKELADFLRFRATVKKLVDAG